MNKSVVGYVFSFVLLVLLQVLVFNRIAIFGYATPFLFLYFILKLPTTLSANWVMTLSFIMGLIIDIFSNTPGMYALAAVTVAFVRRTFIALVLQRGNEETSLVPSFKSFGSEYFSIYTFCIILLFCILVFVIEAFSFFNPLVLILRILSSAVLTFVLVLALESLNLRKK
ncbi:rod shape-determining protein MreD [Coprobacter sp.]